MPAVSLTDEFRSSVKALRGGHTESRDVLRPVKKRGPFEQKATDLARSIVQHRRMLLDARPWYLDALRSSVLFLDDADASRDAHADAERLDAATKSVMNASLVTLGELEAATAKEKHDDLQAHHIGIILVLREHLAQLDQLHSSMRSTRLNQLLARQRLQSQPQLRAQQAAASKPHDSSDDEAADVVDEFDASLDPEERQRLEQENSHLYSELNMLVGEVQLVEQQITEISRLEGILSTHLREQAEVIEQLYDDAVGATMSTMEGNQNLQQATKNSSTNRKFVLIFLILASLSLLFLDMYN